MSYCRFGPESDVYVWEDYMGGYCCADRHDRHERGLHICGTAKEMAQHLREHVALGDKVQPHVIPWLEEETDEE